MTVEITGLDQLLKALNARPPVARVGILGDHALRNGKDHGNGALDNATIGAAHEFGTSTVPKRSFLFVPIAERLDKKIESSGLITEDTTNEVLKQGSVIPWMKEIAIDAEAVVLEAFATGGYGKWFALKPATLARKMNQEILVETQQLRNSITSEVKP